MTQLIPILNIFPREIKAHSHTKKLVCDYLYNHIINQIIASLFVIAKNRELPTFLSADGWITKMWFSHTMETLCQVKAATGI